MKKVSFALLFLIISLSLTIPVPTAKAQESSEGWVNRYSYDVVDGASHVTTTYIGPQVFNDSGVWRELKFEDRYLSEGYFLIENAHITAKVYGWYTVFLDPDNQRVCVDDERWIVEVYNEKTEKWREVDLYNPSLSYHNNETHLTVTRTFDCPEGLFKVSYIVWQGSFLKHDVSFESRMEGSQQFRVTMKLGGIYSSKVRHSEGIETVSSERHAVTPYFFVGENNDNLVFSEYLWSLGEVNEETGEWTATTLQDVVFNTHAKGCKADIIIGNYTLNQDEGLLIDPDSDTFYVGGSADDAYEQGNGYFASGLTTIRVASYADTGSSNYRCGGFRFPDVLVPQGATATIANFSAYIWSSSYDDINCDVYANDVDDASDFDDVEDIIGRDRTSASASWVQLSAGTGWEVNVEIKDVVNEVFARGAWSSGNALALLLIANTDQTKEVSFFSYDQDSSYAAYLMISWEEAAQEENFYGSINQVQSVSTEQTYTFNKYSTINPVFTINSLRTWSFNRYSTIQPVSTVNTLKALGILKESVIEQVFTLASQKNVEFSLTLSVNPFFTVNSEKAFQFNRFLTTNQYFNIIHTILGLELPSPGPGPGSNLIVAFITGYDDFKVSNVTVTIYEKPYDTFIVEVVTDENGTAEVSLVAGDYYYIAQKDKDTVEGSFLLLDDDTIHITIKPSPWYVRINKVKVFSILVITGVSILGIRWIVKYIKKKRRERRRPREHKIKYPKRKEAKPKKHKIKGPKRKKLNLGGF